MAAAKGNQYAARGRVWRDAIDRAMEIRGAGDRMAALNELAARLIEKAAEGDMSALKELGDRLDGKSVQPIAGDAEGPPVALEIGWRKHSS
jgi:hypothetical protein